MAQSSDWPRTIEEAADRILENMSADDRARVRDTKREDLIGFHFGWGTGIRNAFGLWTGNQALLDSSGSDDPDDCSMRIIECVWEKLRATGQ